MTRKPADPRRILFGVTSHISAYAFLRGQLGYLASRGWDVHLLAGSDDGGLLEFARSENATLHLLPTSRDPEASDLLYVLRLSRLLRTVRPSVAVMATPKMGVFGSVAARLAGIPVRAYHVLGFRWDGLTGIMRRFVRGLDRLAFGVSTDVLALSKSLHRRLHEEKLAQPGKITILGHGSLGVDLGRFGPANDSSRQALRRDLGLPMSAPVVCFVARLTRDKGIDELPEVWSAVVDRVPEARLLIVGDPEPGESVEELAGLPNVTMRGHTREVEQIFQASDLNLSLSRREGLGMVPLEAAACGVPTAAFAVTGLVDTIEDGVSGRLIPSRDIGQLVDAVSDLLSDAEKLHRLGARARDHAVRHYRAEDVWDSWDAYLAGRTDAT